MHLFTVNYCKMLCTAIISESTLTLLHQARIHVQWPRMVMRSKVFLYLIYGAFADEQLLQMGKLWSQLVQDLASPQVLDVEVIVHWSLFSFLSMSKNIIITGKIEPRYISLSLSLAALHVLFVQTDCKFFLKSDSSSLLSQTQIAHVPQIRCYYRCFLPSVFRTDTLGRGVP